MNVWIPTELRKQAGKAAKSRKLTLTDAIIEALHAYSYGLPVRTVLPP